MQETLDRLISGKLKGSTQLKLSCSLNSLPNDIYSLSDSLEILDLSQNNLSELTDDFFRFQKLKILFLSENNFTTFPKILSQCHNLDIIGFKTNEISNIEEDSFPANLRWLILTNNKIEILPKSIGKCERLQKLMLAGNYLKKLPDELFSCKNLELLRISANRFRDLPNWIFQLPKLSWLAFAGNFFNSNITTDSPIPEYPLKEFNFGKKLGEGASGNIYQAGWVNNDKPQVAIKLFKGDVTSDGFPSDELLASLEIGFHPNLVNVLGKIKDSDEDKKGLVFDLIPDSYKKLGNPPDFETCTRDTFSEGQSFSLEKILRILIGVSSAITHIHRQGISHGDIYAHNILVEEKTFHTILGDFGAATIYKMKNSSSFAIEPIEVRAFGCLMDDLLLRVNLDDTTLTEYQFLTKLHDECMNLDILSRPSFSDIHNTIANLMKAFNNLVD